MTRRRARLDPRRLVVPAAAAAAILWLAIMAVPDRPAARFRSIAAPSEAAPGEALAIAAVIDSRVGPLDCLVVSQVYVVKGELASPDWFVRLPTTRQHGGPVAGRPGLIRARFDVRLPRDTPPGVASLVVRETYACPARRLDRAEIARPLIVKGPP